MSTHCPSCGAPFKRGADECLYCDTMTTEVTTEILMVCSQSEFSQLRRQFLACDWDEGRDALARALAHTGTRFTAGQVRVLASTYDWDKGRINCFQHLRDNIVNQLGLLHCGDVFDWDDGRVQLMQLVPKGATSRVRWNIEQDDPRSIEGDCDLSQGTRRSSPGGGIGCLNILAATLLLVLSTIAARFLVSM